MGGGPFILVIEGLITVVRIVVVVLFLVSLMVKISSVIYAA